MVADPVGEIALRKEGGAQLLQKGVRRQKKGKEAGHGQRRHYQFRDWSDQEVRDEFDRVGALLDKITSTMQEGKLTSGQVLARPYRGRPMFVGVLVSGFGGDWITKGSCYVCASPHNTARCLKCQRGICEGHVILIGEVGQGEGAHGPNTWQGASLACCSNTRACESRQRQILEFWKRKAGGRLD